MHSRNILSAKIKREVIEISHFYKSYVFEIRDQSIKIALWRLIFLLISLVAKSGFIRKNILKTLGRVYGSLHVMIPQQHCDSQVATAAHCFL